MTAEASKSVATVAPPQLQARVRAIVDRGGLTLAARELGMARATVANIVAGLPVKPGSIFQAEALAPQK